MGCPDIPGQSAISPAPATDGAVLTPGGIAVTGFDLPVAKPSPGLPEPPPEADIPIDIVKGPWKPEDAAPNTARPASEDMAPLALTWGQYSAWRRAKCPPPEFRGAIWMDELDQAIHELIGEIAEVSQILLANGPFVLLTGDPDVAKLRKKVQDEIGDVVFTASWVFDCIDPSFFGTRGRVAEGFLPPDELERLARHRDEVMRFRLSAGMLNMLGKAPEEITAAIYCWVNEVNNTLLTLSMNAGLISNRFKKIRWHRVKSEHGNPFYEQGENLFYIMVGIDALCALTGLSLLHAAHFNMEKLDRRFPDGWKPGGGKRS